jgi:hypothetical protein
MSKSKQTTENSEGLVRKALKDFPGATTQGIASAAGIGRSTASKLLARLESADEVVRTKEGREGARKLPDRWSLAENTERTSDSDHTAAQPRAGQTSAGKAKPRAAKSARKATAEQRLRPGQLDGLVLTYLQDNAASGPHGPGSVAKALNRSSGAVGNCLVRLTRSKQARQVGERPRRYSIPRARS